MKNIYKRYNGYYFRINIPIKLGIYFDNKRLYIKVINTKNKIEAIKLRNILYNKFQIIKDGLTMKLDEQQIQALVYDFKNTRLDEIVDKYNYIVILV